ncbi:MAG: hypothetical protein JST35_01255 [Armatimonadetes bacterium]|nr:hypothetical protein [Armatimonadota bacterium]
MISDAQLEEAFERAKAAGVPLHPNRIVIPRPGEMNAYDILQPLLDPKEIPTIIGYVKEILGRKKTPEAEAAYRRVMDLLRQTREAPYYLKRRNWDHGHDDYDDLKCIKPLVMLALHGSHAFEEERYAGLAEAVERSFNLVWLMREERSMFAELVRSAIIVYVSRSIGVAIKNNPESDMALLVEPHIHDVGHIGSAIDMLTAEALVEIGLVRNVDQYGGEKQLRRMFATDQMKDQPPINWRALPAAEVDRERLLTLVEAYTQMFNELGDSVLMDPNTLGTCGPIYVRVPKRSAAKEVLHGCLDSLYMMGNVQLQAGRTYTAARAWVIAGLFYNLEGRWPESLEEAQRVSPEMYVSESATYRLTKKGPEVITVPIDEPDFPTKSWPHIIWKLG